MTTLTSSTVSDTNDLLTTFLEKFSTAEACWYSSVRENKRTHLAPIWHVLHEQLIYVVTQPSSVRARNLKANPSVSLALPDPMNVVIIEGVAAFATDATQMIQPLFQTKYNWDIISDTNYHTVIRVTPTKLLAWGNHGIGRWAFNASKPEWSELK